MKKLSLLCLALFGVVFFQTLKVSAAEFVCACCAERGHYSVSTKKPESFVLDELKRIKFDSAQLYTDAGYPETIKGIAPLGDTYTATGTLSGNLWKFIFKDDKAKTGTLNLAKPVSMVEYMVDQTPLAGESAGEPVLYKEWRFKYNVGSGTGIFQGGIAPKTEYFLVLQGKGNVCTSAEQFETWRLEVTGAKARYAFFGKVSAE